MYVCLFGEQEASVDENEFQDQAVEVGNIGSALQDGREER
jgi:hypothetical protein